VGLRASESILLLRIADSFLYTVAQNLGIVLEDCADQVPKTNTRASLGNYFRTWIARALQKGQITSRLLDFLITGTPPVFRHKRNQSGNQKVSDCPMN
jgi:hypothetical protein